MGGQLTCYMKKKTRTCLENQIYVLDRNILEKKRQYQFVEEQIKHFETCLDQRQYEPIMTRPLNFYDGFSWEVLEQENVEQKTLRKCPYLSYGCEAVYTLKKNVLGYHTNRLIKLLNEYNQWVSLLLAMRNEKRGQGKGRDQIIFFGKQPILYLGYSFIGKFKPILDYKIFIDFWYMQDSLEVFRESIQLTYQNAEKVLDGTYLKNMNEESGIFQIQFKQDELPECMIEPIARGIQEIIEALKKAKYKRHSFVIGSYIEIGEMLCWQKNAFITKLKPLGYHPVGKVKNAQYIEQQLLVNIRTSHLSLYKR